MLLVYFHIYVLYPKYILKKKFVSYILFFIISLVVFYIIRTELIYYFINQNVWPESQSPQRAYSFNHIVIVFFIGIYDVALVTTMKLTAEWIFEKKRAENLKELQIKTELQFLKAQIQPHFFFNTLNNLYALTLEQSKQAPEVVLKLSEIMEYILYDAKEPEIKLLKEINYIQNYIDLEKLRYGERVEVNLTIEGEITDQKVPPLLFLPFIENCFKHGAKENNNLKININFKITKNNKLHFSVINNFKNSNLEIKKHGIGNENVKRRLELLFNDKHSLSTNIKKLKYKVDLKIQL